jgi:capsid protein
VCSSDLAVKLAEKLRTMAKAKMSDGEAFCLQISNPGLPTPVKLDLRTIEADQVRFVDISLLTVPSVDGIRFDDYGNPVSYHVLRVHPGFWSYATGYIGFPWEYDVWPAKFVLHWFRSDRAGQHRGLPEILAALPLFAQLRRVSLAVLQAYETAADFSMWMKTPAAAEGMAEDDEPIEVPNPFDLFPLQRNIVTTLPDGYDIGQTKAEHPRSEHEAFCRCIIREIGRAIKAPYQKIAGDASQSNFSAANHDDLDWWRGIDETHKDLEYGPLDRVLAAWLLEARGVRTGGVGDFGQPYVPANVRRAIGNITGEACDLPTHTWNWQGMEWPNPAQEATADQTNLQMGTTTYQRIYGRQGADYRKAHLANAKALGMSVEDYRKKVLLPNLVKSPTASAEVEQAEEGGDAQTAKKPAKGVKEPANA